MEALLKEYTSDQLLRLFKDRKVGSRARTRDYFCDEIAYNIALKGDKGAGVLLDLLADSSQRKKRSLIYFLPAIDNNSISTKNSKKIKNVLLDAFSCHDLLIKADALHSLRHQNLKLSEKQVLPFVKSSTPYLAACALSYVCEFYKNRMFGILKRETNSRYFLVRETVADEIDDRRLKELLPVVIKLCKDRHPDVRQAAITACANLMR